MDNRRTKPARNRRKHTLQQNYSDITNIDLICEKVEVLWKHTLHGEIAA